jgi:hypothetical protein
VSALLALVIGVIVFGSFVLGWFVGRYDEKGW